MNYKTHVIGGISAGVVANEIFSQHLHISGTASQMIMSSVFIAGAVVGSLIPDIDHRKSFFGRRAKLLSVPMSLITGHRGLTHTPFFLMIIVGILISLSNTFLSGSSQLIFSYMSLGLGIGIASHIFLDALTKEGVPLLYPIRTKKFRLLPLKTGGILENFVSVALIIGTIVFMSGKLVLI